MANRKVNVSTGIAAIAGNPVDENGKAKKTKTRKTRTRTGAAKRTAAPKSVTVNLHYAEGSSPFAGLTGTGRGALLLAALVVGGFAKLNKATIGAGSKGNAKVVRRIVGPSAFNHHKSNGRIDMAKGTVSKAGVAWFNGRVAHSSPNMRTDIDTIRGMVDALQNGGEVAGLKFEHATTID